MPFFFRAIAFSREEAMKQSGQLRSQKLVYLADFATGPATWGRTHRLAMAKYLIRIEL
jgi:hypothetical protein